MSKPSRLILGVLVALNLVVLLGQLWPEGAPPFARGVNIVFLVLSLLYFAAALLGRAGAAQRGRE